MDIISGIRNFLVTNVPKMVIKYSRDAKRCETLESKKAADVYMSARNGTDSWVTYSSFNREMILNAASLIPTTFSETEIRDFMRDKNLINVRYFAHRDKFVQAAHDWILHNYEEKNEYYRMLAGLPPIGAPDLYFDDIIYDNYNTERVPVHKVPHSVLISMDMDGSLDTFQQKYPEYKYISHLGNGRIDVALARMADNFDVLYIPKKIDNDSYQRDFLRSYDQAREYILTVVYNMYYSAKYEYYDNYMAFITLMMAVQRLVNNVYEIVVNRDFYDMESIRIFLTAYNIPYSGFFNLYQNRLLVKNLNILLKKKSTTRVLVDIMDLLGFNNYELVKYYLVKKHRTNENGMPILKYLQDENGNYILDANGEKILDAESVYDFYFSGVPIESDDIQQDIMNSDFIVDYKTMVESDNLWVDDNTTKKLLMETDFNYMQTKYIDVKVIYRLQEIIFETVYTSRMILDNASTTKKIKVSMNMLSDAAVSLFDGIVMLICLMCKMHGVEPTLLSKLSEVSYIMGFNFNADFEAIKSDIIYNRIAKYNGGGEYINVENLYNSNIAKYITKTVFTTPDDVNAMFINIRELRKLLLAGLADSTNLMTYRAYKRLYDSLMFTQVNNSIYNLSDGTTPATFADYLRESNHALYELYQNCDPNMISEYIDYITQRLGTLFTDTQYFPYIKLLSGEDVDALLKLLRFFKSYTVNIRKAHINLLLDDRYDNMIHVIDNYKALAQVHMSDQYTLADIPNKINAIIKASETSTQALEKVAILIDNFVMREKLQGIHKPTFDASIHQSSSKNVRDTVTESADVVMGQDVHLATSQTVTATLKNDYKVYSEDVVGMVATNKIIEDSDVHDGMIEDVTMKSSDSLETSHYLNIIGGIELSPDRAYGDDKMKFDQAIRIGVKTDVDETFREIRASVSMTDVRLNGSDSLMKTDQVLSTSDSVGFQTYANMDIGLNVDSTVQSNESILGARAMMKLTPDMLGINDPDTKMNGCMNQINKVSYDEGVNLTHNVHMVESHGGLDIMKSCDAIIKPIDKIGMHESVRFIYTD